MPIHINCDCGKKLRVPDERAGKKVKCPGCGAVLSVPAAEPEAAPVAAGDGGPLSGANESPWCAKCGHGFPADEMVEVNGRTLCQSCAQQEEEGDTGSAPSSGPGRKALVIGGAVAVLIIAVAVVRYSTTGKPSKPTDKPSPIAAVQKTNEPPAPPEQPAQETPDAGATSNEPAGGSDSQTTASSDAGRQSANSAKPDRDPVDLLWTFLPTLSESFETYRDHELTLTEQELMQKLLSDEGLVGDEKMLELPYPVPDPATWAASTAGKMPQQDSAATLDVYVRGKGITLDDVKKRFGPPRLEKKAPDGLCLVYGNAGVVFGKKNEFMGVVAVLIPETDKKPADGQGEASAVAAATPRDEATDKAAMTGSKDETAGKLASAERPESLLPDKKSKEADSRKPAPPPEEEKTEQSDPSKWGPKFTLEYQPIRNPEDPLAALGRNYAIADGQNSPNYHATLGGQKVAMTIEQGQQQAIRVDTNGDGNLSDEKRIPGIGMTNRLTRSTTYRFGPITFDPGKEGVEPIQFYAQTYSASSLRLSPACCRTGDVRLAGDTYHIAIVDSNLDGRYDRPCRFPVRFSGPLNADGFAIDRNKNKRFDPGGADQWEVQPLTRLVGVKDKYCILHPTPDGSAIQLEDTTPKRGTLDVGQSGVELLVLGDAGVFRLTGDGKWNLPEGRYSCWSVLLRSNGSRKGGDNWLLSSTENTGKLQSFEVDEGQTTDIAVGPPLIVRTSANEAKSSSDKIISIGLRITDRAGVEYEAGAVMNGQKLPPPALRILGSAGRAINTGKFAYG